MNNIDEYIEWWEENLLSTEGSILLMDALIEQRTDLLAQVERLRNALMTCAQTAGDDPFFNEGGEGYEALFGDEEED